MGFSKFLSQISLEDPRWAARRVYVSLRQLRGVSVHPMSIFAPTVAVLRSEYLNGTFDTHGVLLSQSAAS